MLESLLKKGLILYVCLTLVEYGLTAFGGSLLKFYGYVLVILWLLLKQGKIPTLKKNRPLSLLIFYLIYSFVTLLWSVDPAMGGYYFLAMANMFILIVIASSLSWEKGDVSLLLTAFQIAAAVFSILLIAKGQNYSGVSRATLTINGQEGDPNNLAAMLVIPILISIWKILNGIPISIFNKKYNVLNFFIIFIGIWAMLMISSRGGLLALFSGTLFLLLFNNRYVTNKKKSKKFSVITVLIIIIAIILFIIPYIHPELLNRLTYSKIEHDQGSDRLIIWEMALHYLSIDPNFGIGIGSFQGITHLGVHNQLLIVLVESGIVGFILFMSFLTILFKKNLKSNTSLLPALLVATIVVIFFLDAYNKKFFWNAILISIIILKMERTEKLRSFRAAIKAYEYTDLQ
jgi:O-antigen ligase